MKFDGPTITNTDVPRLSGQVKAVFDIMSDGSWRDLEDLAQLVGCRTQSVSARLRDLRKERFGGHTVERKRGSRRGLFVYRLVVKRPTQGLLFG